MEDGDVVVVEVVLVDHVVDDDVVLDVFSFSVHETFNGCFALYDSMMQVFLRVSELISLRVDFGEKIDVRVDEFTDAF